MHHEENDSWFPLKFLLYFYMFWDTKIKAEISGGEVLIWSPMHGTYLAVTCKGI